MVLVWLLRSAALLAFGVIEQGQGLCFGADVGVIPAVRSCERRVYKSGPHQRNRTGGGRWRSCPWRV